MNLSSSYSYFLEEGCDFLLSEEEAINDIHTPLMKLFILVFVPVVLTFGLVVNIAFLLAVYRFKHMRNTTNFYLCNLAVSDSLLLIVTSSRYLVSYFNAPIYFGETLFTGFGCATSVYLAYLCYFTSTLLVTLVTFERYLAICHPMKHLVAWKGKNFERKLILATWLISSLLACLCLHFYQVEYVCIEWSTSGDYSGLSSQFPSCYTTFGWMWFALDIVDATQFCLTLSTSSFMYCRLIYTLCGRSGQQSRQTQARQQVARMLILNGTVFFLLITPFQLVIIDNCFYYFDYPILTDDQHFHIVWIGRVATQLNAAVNPVIYMVSNPKYRKAFVNVFRTKARLGLNRGSGATGSGTTGSTSMTSAKGVSDSPQR